MMEGSVSAMPIVAYLEYPHASQKKHPAGFKVTRVNIILYSSTPHLTINNRGRV